MRGEQPIASMNDKLRIGRSDLMASNPIHGLKKFEQRVQECLEFVRRKAREEPHATRENASHNRAFQVSAEQYDLLYQSVLAFGKTAPGVTQPADAVLNPYRLLCKRVKEVGYIPEWWKSVENTYTSLLEWTHTCIFFVESIDDTRDHVIQVHAWGDVNMSTVFKNISGSTIINESLVQDSFNSLHQQGNAEAAELIVDIGNLIATSNDVIASTVYEKLVQEVKKPEPSKSVLKSCWDGIVAIVPPVASLADAAAKVFSIST